MKNNLTLLAMLGRQARRYWPACLLATMVALLWVRGSFVHAAPLQQTVPPPTPTQETAPVPTATPVPSDNNDDDDDDIPPTPAPTWTPTAATQPEPTQPQPPAEGGALTGAVTVERLNVRQGPGTNFGVIGTVTLGQNLTILSRNPIGDWWYVCCASGTDREGWVAAQFVQPTFDLGQANTLVPVAEALPEAPPEPTATPTVDPAALPTPVPPGPELELQLQQAPLNAWQGQTITLTYQINNRSDLAATALELRNDLPAELTFVSAPLIGAGAFVTETTGLGSTVVVIRWPELQAGATVTASVQVRVAEQLVNGSVFDNLAVVMADGAQPVTAGISIGMPPTTLPNFR